MIPKTFAVTSALQTPQVRLERTQVNEEIDIRTGIVRGFQRNRNEPLDPAETNRSIQKDIAIEQADNTSRSAKPSVHASTANNAAALQAQEAIQQQGLARQESPAEKAYLNALKLTQTAIKNTKVSGQEAFNEAIKAEASDPTKDLSSKIIETANIAANSNVRQPNPATVRKDNPLREAANRDLQQAATRITPNQSPSDLAGKTLVTQPQKPGVVNVRPDFIAKEAVALNNDVSEIAKSADRDRKQEAVRIDPNDSVGRARQELEAKSDAVTRNNNRAARLDRHA